MLDRLGNPERALPPVLHVAGTNGKGSTCAFLRAAIEAAGMSAHVYTTPHLVSLNERFRLAGRLIGDDLLARLLEEVLDAAEGIAPTFFEVTTAAALLGFARIPADACVIEVGLGGRRDATNVFSSPTACGITQLAADHRGMLGGRMEDVAEEKAGIARGNVPLVTQRYPRSIAAAIERVADSAGATWLPRGHAWDVAVSGNALLYHDRHGPLELPLPGLNGAHQALNAALAVAMLRHQDKIGISDSALRAAMGWVDWPGRLQRLTTGPLRQLLPAEAELWLDSAHNPAAARAMADFFHSHVPAGRPLHLIAGILARKDAARMLKPFAGRAITLHSVAVTGHICHSPADLAAAARTANVPAIIAGDVETALRGIARHADRAKPPIVLVFGSLFLAGQVLKANGQLPC